MAFSILRLTRRSIGKLGIALIVIAPLAAFALTPADIAPLAGDDFDAKSAAIDKLIPRHCLKPSLKTTRSRPTPVKC